MKHLLLAKGLWEHVEGTAEIGDDANAQAKDKFAQKSQKAFQHLCICTWRVVLWRFISLFLTLTFVSAISTNQLYLVTLCDGPNKAWE